METNLNNNIETVDNSEKHTGFWHGSWAYLVFFVFIAGVMTGISYLIKWLF